MKIEATKTLLDVTVGQGLLYVAVAAIVVVATCLIRGDWPWR